LTSTNVPPGMRRKVTISAEAEGLHEARTFIDDAAAEAGFDEAVRYQITMAANEAISNALEHGSPCVGGRIHISAALEQQDLVLHVADCGNFGADSPDVDPIAERGRGFAFMNLLMDDVSLEVRPGWTVVRLVKRRADSTVVEEAVRDEEEQRNLDLVRDLVDAFSKRDFRRIAPLVDLGVMFEPLSTEVRQRTPCLGRAALREYLTDLDETWDEFELTLDELRARGSHVAALCRIRARAGDWLADAPAGIVWRIRGGRAVWGKVYPSVEEALDAAGLGP
jgi:anti-sigma regulatory factor (Ser/Thr protein kinase)/ketosteroid isomerase-like protein